MKPNILIVDHITLLHHILPHHHHTTHRDQPLPQLRVADGDSLDGTARGRRNHTGLALQHIPLKNAEVTPCMEKVKVRLG